MGGRGGNRCSRPEAPPGREGASFYTPPVIRGGKGGIPGQGCLPSTSFLQNGTGGLGKAEMWGGQRECPVWGGGDWTHPHRRNRRAHAHDEGRRATQPPPPVRGRAEKRACRPSRRHHTNGASGAPPKRHIPTQASSSSGSPPPPPPEPPTHATPSPSHTNSARRVPPPGRATAYRRPAAPCATQKATRRASVDGPPSRPSASRSQRGLGSHPPPLLLSLPPRLSCWPPLGTWLAPRQCAVHARAAAHRRFLARAPAEDMPTGAATRAACSRRPQLARTNRRGRRLVIEMLFHTPLSVGACISANSTCGRHTRDWMRF